jgi:hypothetical protein
MEKVVKMARSDSTWEGCNGLMEFDEVSNNDFVEGDVSQFGERSLWSNRPVFDMDGDIVGAVSGMCTVVGEASSNGQGDATHICSSYYRWTSGDFKSSTLVAEGPKTGAGDASYTFTILGGSGCFAGASGTVRGLFAQDTKAIRTSIQLE